MVAWGLQLCLALSAALRTLLTGRRAAGMTESQVMVRGPVRSLLHLQGLSCALSSVSPSSSREPACVQTCCRRRQSWGLSSKTSHCQAAEIRSPRCTDQLAALSRVRIPALRCSQSCSDVSTQGLAKMSRQGTKAKKGSALGVEGREKGLLPFGSLLLGLRRSLPLRVRPRQAGRGRGAGAALRPPRDAGSSRRFWRWSVCVTQSHLQGQGGQNFCVCNPGKQNPQPGQLPGVGRQ